MNIEEMEKEFNQLMKQGQELLEKMKETEIADVSKKVKRWKPKLEDEYFCVDSIGGIKKTFFSLNSNTDVFNHRIGNCFKTEEEAQKELDRRIAEQELLDMVDAKMSDENCKWIIEYDPRGPVFYPNNAFFRFTTPLLFSSKESCQKAIDTLGDDKLNLIFRID